MTIFGLHFQWLEFHIKIHSMTGRQCAFSAQMVGKKLFFAESVAKISTVAQWTPCPNSSGIYTPDCRLIACKSYIPFLHSVTVTVFQREDSHCTCVAGNVLVSLLMLYTNLFFQNGKRMTCEGQHFYCNSCFIASSPMEFLTPPIKLFLRGHMPPAPSASTPLMVV